MQILIRWFIYNYPGSVGQMLKRILIRVKKHVHMEDILYTSLTCSVLAVVVVCLMPINFGLQENEKRRTVCRQRAFQLLQLTCSPPLCRPPYSWETTQQPVWREDVVRDWLYWNIDGRTGEQSSISSWLLSDDTVWDSGTKSFETQGWIQSKGMT